MIMAKPSLCEKTKGLDRGMYIAWACLLVGYRKVFAFVTNHLRLSEYRLWTQASIDDLKAAPRWPGRGLFGLFVI
jgi:hypothetical protein